MRRASGDWRQPNSRSRCRWCGVRREWEGHVQGTIAGPKLAPDPLPFETLSSFVRTTSRLMPPYRETVLPEGDLADIYAYLQSIPKAPDYKLLPLLAQ